MTDPEYQELMAAAYSHMNKQSDLILDQWKLTDYPRFDWNQDTGQIIFSSESGHQLVADIQFIGSWSETAGTWMWSWFNQSVSDTMKKEIHQIKAFEEKHALTELIDPVWKAPIEAAWDMANLSCHLLDSEMVYRAPDPDKPGHTFLSLKNFRKQKAEPIRPTNATKLRG